MLSLGSLRKESGQSSWSSRHWLAFPRTEGCLLHLFALPLLHFHSLQQVDPGVVLGKLEHLPRPAHKHGPTNQDNPETSQHHHNLEHISPDHSLHAALQDVTEKERGGQTETYLGSARQDRVRQRESR